MSSDPTGPEELPKTETKSLPVKAKASRKEASKSHKQMLAEYYQLTDAQKVFCETYLSNGRKAILAYRKAYPQSAENDEWYRQHSQAILKLAYIQRYLQYADDLAHVRINRILERYCVTKERIVEELAKIAFSRPSDVQEWDAKGVRVKPSESMLDEELASIAEVREQRTKEGDAVVTVKQHDRTAALVQLGKEMGLFKNQVEVKAIVGAKFIIEE